MNQIRLVNSLLGLARKTVVIVLASMVLFSLAALARTSFAPKSTSVNEIADPAGTVELSLVISGLTNDHGHVLVSIFNDADAFPSDGSRAVRTGKVKARNGSISLVFAGLPAGTYAISTFQDENDNGKLDTGTFGIPKEPFGFSNNPVIRFGAPTFEQCRLDLVAPVATANIRLNHM